MTQLSNSPESNRNASVPDGPRERMLAEVRAGLSRPRKRIPSTYFYDQHGSELFEGITRLPEYYPTAAERRLLERYITPWIGEMHAATLVELGAGSAEKTTVILNAMREAGTGRQYVPVDVSAAFLNGTAERLRGLYPKLRITPAVADITQEIMLPRGLATPVLHAFLGGTIGNFEPEGATRLLKQIRGMMDADDRLLLGMDLRKDPAVIEAAYNDAEGITAEFNLNVLRVLNRELGADFQLDTFRHRAFYDRALHRIEMHLVSTRPQTVSIPEAGEFTFREGETIHTEISAKFDRSGVERLFADARLRVERWADDDGLYGLVLGAPVCEG